MRRSRISKVNSSPTFSCSWAPAQVNEPLIGAAVEGSAAQASGMCPSPASRPLVGSKPIQPAPGR
jgi:hypothetical protein